MAVALPKAPAKAATGIIARAVAAGYNNPTPAAVDATYARTQAGRSAAKVSLPGGETIQPIGPAAGQAPAITETGAERAAAMRAAGIAIDSPLSIATRVRAAAEARRPRARSAPRAMPTPPAAAQPWAALMSAHGFGYNATGQPLTDAEIVAAVKAARGDAPALIAAASGA